MTSTLGFAVLSLLARRELTGYELAQQMKRPVGYFWHAHHSQIYPELARLESAELVRHTVIDGAGPRDTKRYTITAAGTEALRAFVASDFEPQPVRDLETLKIWSIWTVDPDAAVLLVEQLRQVHRERLETYRRELAELTSGGTAEDPSHPDFGSWLTLEGGVRNRAAALEWCDWMLTQLRRPGAVTRSRAPDRR